MPGHEPCEEYIENLTSKPWWETNQFSWVADLESKSELILKELIDADLNKLFISDSRSVVCYE